MLTKFSSIQVDKVNNLEIVYSWIGQAELAKLPHADWNQLSLLNEQGLLPWKLKVMYQDQDSVYLKRESNDQVL